MKVKVCTPISSAEHCAPHTQHLPPHAGTKIWAAMDTHGFGALKRPTGGPWGGPIRKKEAYLK